jgi:hypothetical protein
MTNIDDILTSIAREHFGMATLETRRSDALDFREVAVWTVKDALTAAYDAGARSVSATSPADPSLTDKQLSEIDVDELLAKRHQVAIVWCVEDVQQNRPDLNADQAWEVLQECRSQHDCDIGFTWEFIDIVAEQLYPE